MHSPTFVCCPFLGRLAEFTDVAIGHIYNMERQRRGIKKIIENYETEPNYSEDLKPEFFSDTSQFSVVLKNLNYGKSIEKLAIEPQKVAIEDAINSMKAHKKQSVDAVP